MRCKADLTAGSLKLRESRVIADLLLDGVSGPVFRQTSEADPLLGGGRHRTAESVFSE